MIDGVTGRPPRAGTRTGWGSAINLVRWGSYGVPVLVFPTAGGDAEEIERHHLLGHLTPLLDEGRIKVYSCDSIAGRAMAAGEGSVEYRCRLFNQFQQAIAHEVVPAIHADCGGPNDGRSSPAPRSGRSTRWR